MKTTNVKAMSESESWICHQLCRGFFAYCAMDCCVNLLEKAKKTLQFLHVLTLLFSVKLNAFESILLVCLFLRYWYVAMVAFTSNGFAPNHRL